jgi:hypothetical protein
MLRRPAVEESWPAVVHCSKVRKSTGQVRDAFPYYMSVGDAGIAFFLAKPLEKVY